MKIFELGPGRKFRATAGTAGFLKLEIRQPDRWEQVQAPDLISVATNALALAAVGEPPEGFRFTNDDRYVEGNPKLINPFTARRRG